MIAYPSAALRLLYSVLNQITQEAEVPRSGLPLFVCSMLARATWVQVNP